MGTYKKRVEYVEAEQWRPGVEIPGVSKTGQGFAYTNTPIGNVEVHEGDWVVMQADGVRFVLCPEEFEKEYEAEVFDDYMADAMEPAAPDLAAAEPEPQGKAGNPPRPEIALGPGQEDSGFTIGGAPVITDPDLPASGDGASFAVDLSALTADVLKVGAVPGEDGPARVDLRSLRDAEGAAVMAKPGGVMTGLVESGIDPDQQGGAPVIGDTKATKPAKSKK